MDPVDLDAVRERVYAEAQRFREQLPVLMQSYLDQWVVFRDGIVVSAHPSEDEAYLAGIRRFGMHGGHIVAAVREPELIYQTAILAAGR